MIYSSTAAARRTQAGLTVDLFEQHQGTHILQVNIFREQFSIIIKHFNHCFVYVNMSNEFKIFSL